jgi:hypothetical protein
MLNVLFALISRWGHVMQRETVQKHIYRHVQITLISRWGHLMPWAKYSHVF